jgi:PAS domain S-box-containing protein
MSRITHNRIVRGADDTFQVVFERASVALAVIDLSGHFVEANKRFCALLGLTKRRLLATTIQQIISQPDLLNEDELAHLAAGRVNIFSVEADCNLPKVGSLRIKFDFSVLPGTSPARGAGLVVAAEDSTGRKQELRSLRESEEKFAKAFRCSPLPSILSTVKDGRFIDINEAFEQITGHTREETLGHTTNELGIWENQADREKLLERALQGEKISNVECRLRKKSGEIYIGLLSAEIIDEIGEEPCVVAIVTDITERRRTEEARQETERALKKSEDRYRTLVESSNDWVWEVDSEAKYTYVGPQCRNILGYEPEELIGRSAFDLMPEDEALRVAEVFGTISREAKPFRALENINSHKNGRRVVLETNGTPIFGEHGKLVGYRGMDRDITERKLTETALRESEVKYRTLADNLPGVVFQFHARENVEWGFYFVHENARSLLGLKAEPFDTWGERFAACLEPEDVLRSVATIQRAIENAGIWEFETKFRKPTGEEIYIRGIARPQKQQKELVFHGILLDITPRKRAEQLLRELSGRLINAQEEERRRVARELHDGVGQYVAIAAIELSQIAKLASAVPELSNKIAELSERIKHVASEISHISHQLHPALLKSLGINTALLGLCREISDIHDIKVEFMSGDIPKPMSEDVELCLYRVTQEALHNVVKHSKSLHANVQLTSDLQNILLTIEDDGVGFSVGSVSGGLGLVSMQERLRLVEGGVEIHSEPNRGTRIDVHIPR